VCRWFLPDLRVKDLGFRYVDGFFLTCAWRGCSAIQCSFSQLTPVQQRAANFLGYSAQVRERELKGRVYA